MSLAASSAIFCTTCNSSGQYCSHLWKKKKKNEKKKKKEENKTSESENEKREEKTQGVGADSMKIVAAGI
jgi:hypothetical protein